MTMSPIHADEPRATARRGLALLVLLAVPALAAPPPDEDLVLPANLADLDLPAMEFDDEGPVTNDAPVCIHSAWCEGFQRRWRWVPTDSLNPVPQEQSDAWSDRYIAKCQAAADQHPHNASCWLDLGDALLFRSRWAEAEEAYAHARDSQTSKDYEYARTLYGLAEAQFGGGETNSCISTLAELLRLHIPTTIRGKPNYSAWARWSHNYLTGASPDHLKLPRDTGFMAYPEPQKAEYAEAFTPCPEITVDLQGVARDDARVTLILEKKLLARGFQVRFAESGAYTLVVALDPAARVDRPEGYSLDAGATGAEIRARDKQGVLWGIVSFIQILDPAGKRMRHCRIDDWPDCPRRGYLGAFWSDCTEFTVFNKMNCVTHQRHVLANGRYSPLNMLQAATMAREFKSLGLDLYYGFLTYTQNMGWPYCWNSFLGMQIEAGKKIAALGAGIYYPNDDCRYDTLTEEDEATGLKPSDFDAPHLVRWHDAIKAEYPDFKFQYCPPFYWGPDGRHNYPDDREKYLRSLRILPPETMICWTGARVCTYKKTPSSVKWYSDLIGRKPILFQNRTGPHNRLSYIVDQTDWNGWHYPGFFENDVCGYQKNSHTPTECPQITTLADCLWNVKGYDKARSIRRGLAQYVGEGLYDALAPALGALASFDRYEYGQVTTAVRDENPAEVERDVVAVRKATANAIALVGRDKMNELGSWMRGLAWAEGILKAVRNPPDFRKIHAAWLEKTRAVALSAGYDKAEGDILLDAIDFHGASAEVFPTEKKTGSNRASLLAACVQEGRTAWAKTDIWLPPRKGQCRLQLYAQGACPAIQISLNGKTLYDGANPCDKGWDGPYTKHEWSFPATLLAKGANEIRISHKGNGWHPLQIGYVALLVPRTEKQPEDALNPRSALEDLSLDE